MVSSVTSQGYLTPKYRNIYVPPSKRGATPSSSSSSGLNPHGSSQGGGEVSVSNSISKFQKLDFEIS